MLTLIHRGRSRYGTGFFRLPSHSPSSPPSLSPSKRQHNSHQARPSLAKPPGQSSTARSLSAAQPAPEALRVPEIVRADEPRGSVALRHCALAGAKPYPRPRKGLPLTLVVARPVPGRRVVGGSMLVHPLSRHLVGPSWVSLPSCRPQGLQASSLQQAWLCLLTFSKTPVYGPICRGETRQPPFLGLAWQGGSRA